MEPKEQNIQISKSRQIHKYKEHFDSFQKGGPVYNWMKKVKSLRNTNWHLQLSVNPLLEKNIYQSLNEVLSFMHNNLT